MPAILLDAFNDATLWAGLTPGGTPSAEIALSVASLGAPGSPEATSLAIAATAAAIGHRVRRTVVATDLSTVSELQLWHRSTRPANGGAETPFRLRLALGSATLPVGAPGNSWHRYLPADAAGRWQFVRLALDDLAPAVRAAVTAIEFKVSDASTAFTTWLDSLVAAQPRMVVDVDTALLAVLNGKLVLGGSPVTAMIAAPGNTEPMAPWIRLVQYDAAPAQERMTWEQRHTDFVDDGHRIRPGLTAYDLYYRVDFVTPSRADQSAMLDFVLDALDDGLPLPGMRLRVERVANVVPLDALQPSPVLRFRVAAWAQRGAVQTVKPVKTVTLDTEPAG